MSVALTVPQSARNMFQAGMEHVAQQLQARFKAYATVKTGCTGKSQAHRKIQKAEMSDVTGRLQPTVGQELALEHRYLFPRKASLATILDEDDAAELDLAVAPTGEVVTQHQGAANRKLDDIFIAGICGTNYEGIEDSMSTVAVPATQIIAVNYNRTSSPANCGLSLAKLVQAKGRFGKLEVYGQDQRDQGAKLIMAVSQDELNNLLFDVEKTGSNQYNDVKALVQGEVDYFMGIQFLRSERLPCTAVANSLFTRTCPMWVSNGVHLDFWYDVKTSIDVLPTQSQAVQVYSRIKAGACRKSEDHVVLVYCEQAG
jgi:hypothetical protein